MSAGRVLFCHRLNLGDLVCASPGLQWLRQREPEAAFRLLTNDFSANSGRLMPEIEHVYAYRKFGREAPPEWRALWDARRWRADRVIGVSPSPDRRLGWRLSFLGSKDQPDFSVAPVHAAERLAWAFGWRGETTLPPARLRAPAPTGPAHDVIIYVSARKPSNRPTTAQLVAIVDLLWQRQPGIRIGVYGAPEMAESNAHSPDLRLQREMRDALLLFGLELRTPGLREMFAALASASSMITPDGGLSHIAAGFGKAVATMSGNIDTNVWRPYTPRTRSVQAATRMVPDLDPGDIVAAWEDAIASPA